MSSGSVGCVNCGRDFDSYEWAVAAESAASAAWAVAAESAAWAVYKKYAKELLRLLKDSLNE